MTHLGLDLGTSGLRALLVDDAGQPVASVERIYDVHHPYPGWSEQDPADWIAALESAMVEMAYAPGFDALQSIGVSGHMHGATLLDDQGAVIRPCILWNDTRAVQEAAELDRMNSVRELSGNIVFPGFTAPKLAWIQRNEPQSFERVARVVLPCAYLNYYLMGALFSDLSDGSGTSWLDVRNGDWSDDLLQAGKMRRDQMPRLVHGSDRAGVLRPELAKQWGVSPKVVVAGGAADNAAAACGIGALNEGQGFVSLGTSGVLLVAREACSPQPQNALHTFCHAIPDRWVQAGVTLSAASSLSWLSQITGQTPAELTSDLGDVKAPGRARFLPYLSGERTPHNDAEVRASLTGLSAETSVPDLTRAVLEGVAFSLRDALDPLRETGADFDQLYAIGGGAASDYWLRLIATVLGVRLARPQEGEFGAALGAARLGICAATGASPDMVMTPPQIGDVFDPDQALQPAFETAYQAYRATYPVIKAVP